MPKSKQIKPKREEKEKKGYHPTGDERKVFDQFADRKKELLSSRQNVHGVNIDEKMRQWDRDYFNRQANIPASEIDTDQTPIAINNAFAKVQTALGILIDRNPNIALEENKSKYSANRELIRALAKSSWKRTNSLDQFRLSVFNQAKRGWMVGRTFHRNLAHPARFPNGVDPKTGRTRYITRQVEKVNDIAYMNLDNHNVWIDEEARPGDMYSVRDWMWREVWHIDTVRSIFPEKEFPNMKFVKPGGDTKERIEGDVSDEGGATGQQQREVKKGMTEVFFYEHQYDDWFIVDINGVMVVWEPLPQWHKRLSLVTAPWNLRSAEDIYGIGLIEEMEKDEALIDRILNMSMRQLLLSINPPGFYSGTEDFENENIKLKAGVLRRTMNPQDINFVDIPDMKKEAMDIITWLEDKEDTRTGITKTIEGELAIGRGGDTAFELGISREAGLKRLRLPLKYLQSAFNWEFMNRIDLIKQVYSDFEVRHIVNEEEIMDYLEEVNADSDYYFIENEGEGGQEKFFAKDFKEAQLNVEQNDRGEFVESEEKRFFKVKPEHLPWEGDVTVDMNSILVQSEELEKIDTLRMANLVIPLLEQSPEMVMKPMKQILQAFNKDPKKWLPDAWLKKPEEEGQGRSKLQKVKQAVAGGSPRAVVPPRELGTKPSLVQRLSSAFKTFRNQ